MVKQEAIVDFLKDVIPIPPSGARNIDRTLGTADPQEVIKLKEEVQNDDYLTETWTEVQKPTKEERSKKAYHLACCLCRKSYSPEAVFELLIQSPKYSTDQASAALTALNAYTAVTEEQKKKTQELIQQIDQMEIDEKDSCTIHLNSCANPNKYHQYIVEYLEKHGDTEYAHMCQNELTEEFKVGPAAAYRQAKKGIDQHYYVRGKNQKNWVLTLNEPIRFKLISKKEQARISSQNREQSQHYVPAYHPDLNKLCKGGIRRGHLHGWAVETGHGKTTLSCELAVNMREADFKTLIIAVETPLEDYFDIIALQMDVPVEQAELDELIHVIPLADVADIDQIVSELKDQDFSLIVIDHADPEILEVSGEQDTKVRQIVAKLRKFISNSGDFTTKPAMVITYQLDNSEWDKKKERYKTKISFSGSSKWKQPLTSAFIQAEDWNEVDKYTGEKRYRNNIVIDKPGSYRNMEMAKGEVIHRIVDEKTQRTLSVRRGRELNIQEQQEKMEADFSKDDD